MAIKSDIMLSPSLSISFGQEILFDEMGLRKGNYTTREKRVEILFNYDNVRFMQQSKSCSYSDNCVCL